MTNMMKKSAADSQQFASTECAAINICEAIANIKNSFHSEEEAMEAINEMVRYLNVRGDEIRVKSFVDKDRMSGLHGLGVGITEVWYPSEPGDEGCEYTNWYSIGVGCSSLNTKDAIVIRGIQAAAYLTWRSVKEKAFRHTFTMTVNNGKLPVDIHEKVDLVSNTYNPDGDRKVERQQIVSDIYCEYITYSTLEDIFHKSIIDIIDALEKNWLLKPIVLK